jgi:hypothetical protein
MQERGLRQRQDGGGFQDFAAVHGGFSPKLVLMVVCSVT